MINAAVVGNVFETGSVMFQNDHIQYLMGVGKRYYFSNTDYNRAFDGVIYYTLGTFAPTSTPTKTPTKVPSISPTQIPSSELSPHPTAFPSLADSNNPSITPTRSPSVVESSIPTMSPLDPTKGPSSFPSYSFSPTQSLQSLSASNFVGDIPADGVMFEVISKTNLIVRAFDIHCISTEEEAIEIYNRGSSLGALRSPGAWTKISTNEAYVSGKGKLHV